ncbi:MAG: DUF4080 domain-containing protein [Gammaproteobacteria bacterium]|nr:DUF4080 domain-containing protein [Gammaproteobacteria bacterium]
MPMIYPIILSTLNARYFHSSLGLRYLLANMGEFRSDTHLKEYTINERPIDIVEDLLQHQPEIIGLSVYIWNAEQTTQVVKLIKQVSPDTTIILGGPEVSYELDQQELVTLADYVIPGQADLAFKETCTALLANNPPMLKVIHPAPFKLDEIQFPYDEYSDEDIAKRVIYVEASRGCPFKCEFCLSALDKTAYPFNLNSFLTQMQKLYDRGVRSFKFIDRTFNLKVESSLRILEFFLKKRQEEDLYLHFELIPDHLPDKLKDMIQKFPDHSLQFEIGIQSLNSEVQDLISRKQDHDKTLKNITWIREHTTAHIHADLIIGLPGENIESFAKGFNELVTMDPHEIQVGILKRLRGTPVIRHTDTYDMRFSPYPPYSILSNNLIDFLSMQKLKRFARYWDMIINSGRFKHTKPLLLADSPFENFLLFSEWLYNETSQSHKISLLRQFNLLYKGLTEVFNIDGEAVVTQLSLDHKDSGIKGEPRFHIESTFTERKENKRRPEKRQQRHRSNNAW